MFYAAREALTIAEVGLDWYDDDSITVYSTSASIILQGFCDIP